MRCVLKHPVPYALAASLPALKEDAVDEEVRSAPIPAERSTDIMHAACKYAHHMIRAARAVGLDD